MYNDIVRGLGLSNSYVSSILEKHSDNFSGVNILSSQLHGKKRFSTICNIDGHFTTLIGYPEKIFYIDSFGLPPQHEGVLNFLDHDARVCFINNVTYQHPLSVFCGYYCMYFILFSEREHSNLTQFDTQLIERNDEICVENVCTLLSNKKRRE